MKKILLSIIGFSIIGMLFLNNQMSVAKSDFIIPPDTINAVFHGKFAVTEDVATRQKIYISSFDADFYQSTGKTVYRERNRPFIPPFVGVTSTDNNDIQSPVNYRYYCYAEPGGMYGKVTRIVNVYNDYSSFSYEIRKKLLICF